MAPRWPAWLRWEVAVATVVVAIVVTVVVLNLPDRPAVQAPSVSSASSNPSTTVADMQRPVLVVKIDNVAAARPQTGLGTADVVYVEPVEAGLTRLVAVYSSEPPAVVGPVRSARRTDIELLAQYGKPVLAYSGAAPELLPALRAGGLVNASPDEVPAAFQRDAGRVAPHDLMLHPTALPGGALPPAEPAVQFGAVTDPGTPVTEHRIDYPAAAFEFAWAPDIGRWLVSLDGTPLVSTESGQLGTATVVEQRVAISNQESIEDARGSISPVAQSVGAGTATVLRDGRRFPATWSRPNPQAPTRFLAGSGRPLPLAPGPVWIALVPA